MHYLEKELSRLIKYAEALNIKVIFSNKKSDCFAEWDSDGVSITIYKSKAKKPLELVLLMFHELSHHLAWVHKGKKIPLKTDHILKKAANGAELTEIQRKHLYEDEKSDYQYQQIIHKEIDSKVPLWRLNAEIAFDEWIYRYYWLKNDWPTAKDRKAKKTEFIRKYGKKR